MNATGPGPRHTDEALRATTVPAGPAGSAVARALRLTTGWLTAGRVPRAVWQGLAAFAAYLAAFTAGYGWPLFRHLNTPNLGQYWTDPSFYTWSMSWWPYAVSHGLNPLYTSQIGAPRGYDLAWASTTPAVDLLMWPVTAAFGVLVSYNAMLLLVPPVSAWAAFLLARRLTGRFWPSLLAGLVYGFCPFELVHSWQGQPNLSAIALFPLLAYLVLRWWDGSLRGRWFVVLAAAAMALEFYTFTEGFFDLTAVLAGGLAIGCAVAGRPGWRKAARLAWLTAIGYALAIVAAAPYLYYALRHQQGTFSRQGPLFNLHLIRLVLPWSDKVFGLNALARYSGHVGRLGLDEYVGVPILLVLLGVAVLGWRSRLTRLVVAGFAFALVLALGPDLVVLSQPLLRLPMAMLWNLPIARSAEPDRLIVFIVLALAVALALWLAMPGKSRLLLAARWGLGLLAVTAILWDAPTAYPAVNPVPPGYHPPAAMRPVNQLPPFITDGLYRRYLRPGEIVVIVTHRGNAGMLFQADAGFYFRIAGGFINSSVSPPSALPPQVEALDRPSGLVDEEFADYVRSAGVGAIIVEQAWEEPWMRNFATVLGMRGISAGGVTIYPVAPWLASLAHSAQAHLPRAHPAWGGGPHVRNEPIFSPAKTQRIAGQKHDYALLVRWAPTYARVMVNDVPRRAETPRSYLMCPPEYFEVSYAINPWMRPGAPVDPGLAMRQWSELRATYESLGHSVSVIEPVAGLPDMVFAANGATVIDGIALGVRFKHPERAGEAGAYLSWLRSRGYTVHDAVRVNEGEGDILVAGDTVLAGYGFRSDMGTAWELSSVFKRRVMSLRLVDPRYYHLDTALCVLDNSTAMYYPPAFDDAGRVFLSSVFDELIEAKDEDAEVLGLNAVSDGHHVVLAAQAVSLARSLAARGFTPVPVDMSELLKAGGGAKCCTLELRH